MSIRQAPRTAAPESASAGWSLWGLQGLNGAAYEIVIHCITVGFAFSMILAHAPVIIPAIVHRALPYHRLMWLPYVLLHAGLVVRVVGLLAEASAVWKVGGRASCRDGPGRLLVRGREASRAGGRTRYRENRWTGSCAAPCRLRRRRSGCHAPRPRTSKRPGPSRQEALPAHHPGTSQRPGHGLAAHCRGPGGPDHRGPAGLLGHLAASARPAPGRDRQRHHHLVRPLRRHPPAPPGPGRRRPPGRAPLRPQPRSWGDGTPVLHGDGHDAGDGLGHDDGRGALAPRLASLALHYAVALVLLATGALLGFLISWSNAHGRSALADGFYLAHTTTMLLGFVGTTVLGTLTVLWPTMLRTPMEPVAPRWTTRGLPYPAGRTAPRAARRRPRPPPPPR